MILQNMTPEEKVRQCSHLPPLLKASLAKWLKRTERTVFRTKTFPTMYSYEDELTGMGRWTILVCVQSRKLMRNGVFGIRAYQTYHVTRAKSPENIGMGIFQFDADDASLCSCIEFPPHYFNRVRERLIAPKGIVQPPFPALVKRVIRMHEESMIVTTKGLTMRMFPDGTYGVTKDERYDRQCGYDNLVSYHKEGLSLGVSSAGRRYFHYTTFVDNSLLKDEQREEQRMYLRELLKDNYQMERHPFAPIETKTEWVEHRKDIPHRANKS